MGTVKQTARVKIVSDGTGKGTHVYDAEGNEIPPSLIRSVAWKADGPGPARVTVELVGATLEVDGTLEAGEPDREDITPIWPRVDPMALGRWLENVKRRRDIRRFF